jgi:hypothetical protein
MDRIRNLDKNNISKHMKKIFKLRVALEQFSQGYISYDPRKIIPF